MNDKQLLVCSDMQEEAIKIWEIKDAIDRDHGEFEKIRSQIIEANEAPANTEQGTKKELIHINESSTLIPYRPILYAQIPFLASTSVNIDQIIEICHQSQCFYI